MATNPPKGDNHRIGAVRDRSQTHNPKTDRWVKRDDTTGVWSVTGPTSWKNKPYRYVVKVWAPSVRKVVTNKVTDPYSVALTANSERSLVVDLDDNSLAPGGWSTLTKPKAVPLKDAQIQELHVRDFSVADKTVPKITMVSPPLHGGAISTRTFIPHRCHSAIGVFGAVSVASAKLRNSPPK